MGHNAMHVTSKHRQGRKFFSDQILVHNAALPLVDDEEDYRVTIREYEEALQEKLAIYTTSQLPFRAKVSWEIDVSKGGEIQSHWRRSPPITLSPAMPAKTLHTFVVELMHEYKIALTTITGSG